MKSCPQNSKENTVSPTNVVDGAVGVEKAYWYVAIVNNNSERSIASKLSEDKWKNTYECYVPVQHEERVWKNGRKNKIDRVLLPAMFFVKCTEKARMGIMQYGYVKNFLKDYTKGKNGRYPIAVIPESQMNELKKMVDKANSPVTIASGHFHLGDEVQVISGPLTGLEGKILIEPKGTYLVVEINSIGYAMVQININEVKILPQNNNKKHGTR